MRYKGSVNVYQSNKPVRGKEVMAYHGKGALHHADHLDVDSLLVHILQQPHHVAHAQPLAVNVTHCYNVVAFFEAVSLTKTRGRAVIV